MSVGEARCGDPDEAVRHVQCVPDFPVHKPAASGLLADEDDRDTRAVDGIAASLAQIRNVFPIGGTFGRPVRDNVASSTERLAGIATPQP